MNLGARVEGDARYLARIDTYPRTRKNCRYAPHIEMGDYFKKIHKAAERRSQKNVNPA